MGIRGSPNPIICTYVPVTKKPKPDISTTLGTTQDSRPDHPAPTSEIAHNGGSFYYRRLPYSADTCQLMVNVGTVDSPALGGGYGVGRWPAQQGKSAKRPANVGAPNHGS